jgi:hypothetical protein
MRAPLSRFVSLCIVMTALVAHADGKTGAPPAAGGAGASKPAAPSAGPAQKSVNVADEPGKIAVAYLKALGGDKDQSARELLLGGLTLTAEEVSVSTWRIVGRDAKQVEDASVKAALDELRGLDNAGRKTLSAVVQVAEDDVELQAISQEQAEKIMAPTHEAAKRFQAKFPVFSYCARVGKDVYWHPSNPWRSVVMPQLGDDGDYHLELHLFHIEETVKGQAPRVWPLRVLRIQTKKWDSGWKILPASDWDPEY